MNCDQVRDQDLVEKYVVGQLNDQDMSAFEEHYFSCDECLEAVQLVQAIQQGGARPIVEPAKVIPMPLRVPARPRWIFALAAAAAVLFASVIGWRVFLTPDTGQPQVAKVEPAQPQATPAASSPAPAKEPAAGPQLMASNADLGAVEPLAYRPSVLRGVNDDSSQRFQQAMAPYLKHDYRQSASLLSTIPVGVPGGLPEEHVTDAGIKLYLGISDLMINRNTEALRALRRARAYGDTPYIENASFYLAKALIREKQFPAATVELQRVISLNGDRRAEAKQLLEQLKQVQAR